MGSTESSVKKNLLNERLTLWTSGFSPSESPFATEGRITDK